MLLKKLSGENEAYLLRLGQLKPLIESHTKEIDAYSTKLADLQKKYNESKNFVVEDTSKFITTILAKDNYEWSDYLLNKRNIMLIFLGGEASFKKYQLQITNNKKKYQEEFADLILLIKSTVVDPATALKDGDNASCIPNPHEEVEIPLTFALIKRSKIDPPSTLEFITDKKEKKLLTELHEKSFVGVKVGVSLLNIDRKNFLLDQNNHLTIETDALDPDQLKLNMMALLELYPFGRDYDRLTSFWEKDNIPFYERIGIVAGVKISKDPLETLFIGGSFAVSKAFNVVTGMAFNRIAKDVEDLVVGPNTTLDYLQKNAAKEYTPNLYIGVSVSPGQLFKILGIKK